jgi:hypothetical protein
MVFLERNLENIDGKEIEGRVESHLCVITNAENALTIYDDYYCVCSIKPVDGYSFFSNGYDTDDETTERVVASVAGRA